MQPDYTGNPLAEVLSLSVPIALPGMHDFWGQGPILMMGPAQGCRLWPQIPVWNGDPDEKVPYWLTNPQLCTEYFTEEPAMPRSQMQVMMRAFPYEARQYKRGDGSYEPANQMAVPGNNTGPSHFIGTIGAQNQSTGSPTASPQLSPKVLPTVIP